jgi:hypothetical protein
LAERAAARDLSASYLEARVEEQRGHLGQVCADLTEMTSLAGTGSGAERVAGDALRSSIHEFLHAQSGVLDALRHRPTDDELGSWAQFIGAADDEDLAYSVDLQGQAVAEFSAYMEALGALRERVDRAHGRSRSTFEICEM